MTDQDQDEPTSVQSDAFDFLDACNPKAVCSRLPGSTHGNDPRVHLSVHDALNDVGTGRQEEENEEEVGCSHVRAHVRPGRLRVIARRTGRHVDDRT